MLFHNLLEPHAGVDIQQIVCTLPEAVDVAALRRAWQLVVARHDVLATSLRWEDAGSPSQEVWAGVVMPFLVEDWRSDDRSVQASRLAQFLLADRRAGFSLDVPPLSRVALFRTGDTAYELVWTVHHAICDGRSFVIVLRDVFACYETLRAEGAATLGRGGVAYRDFVAWLAARDLVPAESFWREYLRDFVAPTALPYETPRGGTGEAPGGHRGVDVTLDAALTSSLKRRASADDLTLNTLVQGAWAILLSRHAGDADVVFGAARACRRSNVAGAGDIVGLFINTLPVRVDVSPSQPLGPWLRRLRDRWIELRDWEQTPLARIRSWSEIGASGSLFGSIVNYEHATLESRLRALGGKWATRRVRVYGQPDSPLALEAFGGDELQLKLGYDPARFAEDDMQRVLTQLTTLLAGMADDTRDLSIGDLPWLSEAERYRIVHQWNRTATAYPRDATVADVFEKRVAATPDAIALVRGDRTVTYRELDVRSNQVARYLQRLGVGPGVPVGLCLRHSFEAIVGALGILKSGGAYVPLDPTYPEARLRFMIEDTGLRVVLTLDRSAAAVPAGTQTICLDSHWTWIAGEAPTPPPRGAGAASAAYIMYTSGSTGGPKGVAVTQRGIVRLVVGARYASFGPDEVLLAFAPLTFDASTFEVWGALLNGARLVVSDRDDPTVDDLGSTIRRHGVTTLWLTAALFHQLVDHDLGALRPLRQLLAGGDVLSVPHVRRVLAELPGCRLINGYGPTENTTFTSVYRVPPDWKCERGRTSVPIGRPIENTTAYVLDESFAPVPVGVVGRLYTGGDGVALGYHNRAQLTSERFVADPFDGRPDARLYDTGDRARWLPDGNLEFIGRVDDQVKIRGFRIEPGEVEATLATHPAVASAVAVTRNDPSGAKRLVAYVVAAAGERVDSGTLRAYVAERLPAYLVPSSIVAIEAFPITANGKIDRAALPDPETGAASRRPGYVAPQSALECSLAEIWQAVLGTERVGVHENFFELGGDSILTIAVVSRAREAGFRITPRQLLDRPTIAELAAVAVPAVRTPQLQCAVEGTAPLLPIQRWFFETETRELNYWNQAFLFSVPEHLDVDRIGRALDAVVDHHDALRSRFERSDGQWQQRFAAPGAAIACDRVDFSAVTDGALDAALEAACVRAQHALDIGAGPLVRLVHFRLGPGRRGRLFLAVHHLVVDGVSWRILLEDIESAYGALGEGRALALPMKTTSVQQWARRLTERAADGAFAAWRAYWHCVVATPSRALPRDFERTGPSLERDTETIIRALGADETRVLLQRVPAAYTTHVDEVLVTALASALRGWLGDGPVLVDLEGHGREDLFDDVDLSRTVGWFTTVFPICLELAEAAPRDALRAMKERLRATPQRGLGYGVLRYLERDAFLADASQSELVFNYLGQFDQSTAGSALFEFARESSGAWRGPQARRRYALEINALVIAGRLEIRWTFDRTVHRADTIARVANDYGDALRELIRHCTSADAGGYTPSDFPLARVDQAALDAAIGVSRDVEDVYPLSSIQALFALFVDPANDPGFEQWRYRLFGPLDVASLRTAWQTIVDRHSILRTAFVTDGLSEPLQIVRRNVALPWAEHDLRGLAPHDRARRLAELLQTDRATGFVLECAPLLRLTLVRLADDEYELVWSLHHLLIDRWSFPIVLAGVENAYRSLCDGHAPAPERAVPYRDYIRWLATQDAAAAETFWRGVLAELPPPRPLGTRASDALDEGTPAEVTIEFEATGELRAFAQSHRLARNTVVLGAWALCFGQLVGMSDLLIGLAVSGRPAALPGVERLVGVTINNLPLRARCADDDEVLPWLRRLAEQQVEAQQFAFTPLKQLQEWSGVPWRQRLFESIVVFQHASADARTAAWLGPSLRIEQLHTPTRTAYPLSLMVAGDEVLSFRMTFDRRYFTETSVRGILERFQSVLRALCAEPNQSLRDVRRSLPVPDEAADSEEIAARGRRTAVFVAPASATEAMVAHIWSDFLGVERLGAADDFFALGGQSLLAMQVVLRVRETFGVELPLRALFKAPTVAEFARALVACERVAGRTERIARVALRVAHMSGEELRLAAASADAVRGEPEGAHAD
ncbi:MAG: hypothetical protein NVSMB19_20010 [Vulcanimicrobiaceae bacterium]